MKRLLTLAFILYAVNAHAQLMDGPHPLTMKDTLRGMLTPMRTCYDVTFYDLHVRVDLEKQGITGENTIYYTAVTDFQELQIDLFANMEISAITWKGKDCSFTRKFDAVFVRFPGKVKKGDTGSFTVSYHGSPQIAKNPPWDGGFTYASDVDGNPWLGVSCEGLGASVWWPNKDHLSDEPDSMSIRVEVRDDLQCISNGNLRKSFPVANGYREFDWFVSYPINNYNVTLNIGKYAHFHDAYIGINGDTLDLDYYVLPQDLDKAKKQFIQVKPMLTAYEKYLGPYPFYKDGYALVQTPYLGMEHQSAIAYGNGYKNGYSGFDYSGIGLQFDYIIIHESGHEWWGNNVSCADIADMWIHEGFCTYSESLYVEDMYGYDVAMKYMDHEKTLVGNDAPVIGRYNINEEGSGDMYPKGALLLNTIRTLTDNDKLWWSILRGIQHDFALQTVSSAQIESYIMRKAGKDYSKVFDQYLRHAAIPVMEYSLTQSDTGLLVRYHWIADVPDFNMPLRYNTGKNDFVWVYPTTEWQEMLIPDMQRGKFKWDSMHFYFKENVVRSN
ncbi:MAG: M1 family metallopeptidase [Chitinophagales bacterium]